jgi:hypothetical protein
LYNMRDVATGGLDLTKNVGLYRTNWTPKEAAAAVKQLIDELAQGTLVPIQVPGSYVPPPTTVNPFQAALAAIVSAVMQMINAVTTFFRGLFNPTGTVAPTATVSSARVAVASLAAESDMQLNSAASQLDESSENFLRATDSRNSSDGDAPPVAGVNPTSSTPAEKESPAVAEGSISPTDKQADTTTHNKPPTDTNSPIPPTDKQADTATHNKPATGSDDPARVSDGKVVGNLVTPAARVHKTNPDRADTHSGDSAQHQGNETSRVSGDGEPRTDTSRPSATANSGGPTN